jgi:C_GCAxxG_C_C family probable redox protein
MKQDESVDTFRAGFNCAQAVLKPFAEAYGLDGKTSHRIASVFGGGMARMQETCGAVTGAFMAIGLKYGFTTSSDQEQKKLVAQKGKKFADLFRKEFGALACRELLGCDFNTAEGNKKHVEENQRELICTNLVKRAAEIVESL